MRISTLLFLVACGPDLGQVSIALRIPDRVDRMTLAVVDPDLKVVASATVSGATEQRVLLGVPAELPLEFRAVGWLDAPAPLPLKALPAYAARSLQEVPLGDQIQTVFLVARPAGILQVVVNRSRTDDETLWLESDDGLPAWPLRLRSQVVSATVAYPLRVGYYRIRSDSRSLAGGQALYVGREQLTVAPVRVLARRYPVERTLQVSVVGADPLELKGSAELLVEARGEGDLSRPNARITAIVEPADALGLLPPRQGLPARWSLRPKGTGHVRVRIRVQEAELIEDRWLNLNLGPSGAAAARLQAALADPGRLAEGTELNVAPLDAEGRLVRGPWRLSLDAPPWVRVIARSTHSGAAVVPVIRGGAVEGQEMAIGATLTSTRTGQTLTASVSLPALR